MEYYSALREKKEVARQSDGASRRAFGELGLAHR